MIRGLTAFFCLSIWLCAPGCGTEAEPQMGDHCSVDGDCPDTCQTGGGFPDGICTKHCEATTDCPDGWKCISKSSGICMRGCTGTEECAGTFGESWVCDDEALQGESGDATVCIGK